MLGDIEVFSKPGKGTIFKIYLPLTDTKKEVDKSKKQYSIPYPGSETILVVEDETVLLKLISRILRRNGYEVLEAVDGDMALKLVENHQGPIHVTITDVVMPKISGKDLAEKISSLRPDMKVIYMSGYTDSLQSINAVFEPEENFIQKPFSSDELMDRIYKVLKKDKEEN